VFATLSAQPARPIPVDGGECENSNPNPLKVKMPAHMLILVALLALIVAQFRHRPRTGEADAPPLDPGRLRPAAPSPSAETIYAEAVKNDPLVAAIVRDDVDEVARLLVAGRSPTAPLHFQRTPLHFAAGAGAIRCVQLLLEKGADLEALNTLRHTPLIEAVGNRKTETAACLLRAGARVSWDDTRKDTPESRAELHRKFEDQLAQGRKTFPAMHALLGDPKSATGKESVREVVDILVESCFVPNQISAVQYCWDFATLRLLVEEHGADSNVASLTGNWPLWTFAASGDAEVVTWLLQHGAKPDFTDCGRTALHAAVAANQLECTRLLLAAGANPNQADVDGGVPLIGVQTTAMLDLLLEHGADPTIGDDCGFKPSHWVKNPALKARLLAQEAQWQRKHLSPHRQ
jgi:ankyrin repeat protein